MWSEKLVNHTIWMSTAPLGLALAVDGRRPCRSPLTGMDTGGAGANYLLLLNENATLYASTPVASNGKCVYADLGMQVQPRAVKVLCSPNVSSHGNSA
jgi:hypothetical protein